MNWEPHAARLADKAAHPASRWHPVIASVPRHPFVPHWWAWAAPGPLWHDTWELRDGAAEPGAWLNAAYADKSLITQVGGQHADHASPGDKPTGMPTSSATLPGLLVQMYRHAMISDSMDVLDVGTGSGYGTALLATRLGDSHVTSIDLDGYLTEAAAERLGMTGLHPKVHACDATGELPGTYDRIVSTVAVRPVPAAWLAALRPGGRLVTNLSGTSLIITADKTPDGGATGRTEWDRAGFMNTRNGPSYPPEALEQFNKIRDARGDEISSGQLPVVNVPEAWELYSTLGVMLPGIRHHYEQTPDGKRTAWMLHPDGSWARATAASDTATPIVHQSGPRRLWTTLDEIRRQWLHDGSLPVYGAKVTISPDGDMRLTRGRWEAEITA